MGKCPWPGPGATKGLPIPLETHSVVGMTNNFGRQAFWMIVVGSWAIGPSLFGVELPVVEAQLARINPMHAEFISPLAENAVRLRLGAYPSGVVWAESTDGRAIGAHWLQNPSGLDSWNAYLNPPHAGQLKWYVEWPSDTGADISPQRTDGTIFLRASGKNSKNGWSWEYQPSRPGRYRAIFSFATEAIQEIPLMGSVTLKYAETEVLAHWPQVQVPHAQISGSSLWLGDINLKNASTNPISLELSADLENHLSANQVALILIPTTEGVRPAQMADGGPIELHSRNATINGLKLQYEPQPNKITVGYWIHVTDCFYWDFQVSKPGRYTVRIFQGCGKGQGGSQAAVVLGDQSLPFLVEDTGHFQNFVPRDLGEVTMDRAGIHRLWVKALVKAKGAVMDVRQLHLIPIENHE